MSPPSPTPKDRRSPQDRRRGLLLGIGAYLFWGVLPLYFPLLAPAGPLEIIAHRIVWSLLFCLVLLIATRSLGQFTRVWRSRRLVGLLTVAAVLIAVNWTVYVVGVLSGHVIDAALGYFINPLITILLAVTVLRERLRLAQWVALGIGALAVLVITVGLGRVPWVSLTLAVTFGLYGLIKSRVGKDVTAAAGLTVETAVLTPFALGYLIWLGATGSGTFTDGVWHATALAAAGIVTATPLIMFSAAARHLPLSIVGMLQYLAPLMQFLIGLVVFDERMPPARWAGFALVWIALLVITVDALRVARRTRLAGPTDPPAAPERPATVDPGSRSTGTTGSRPDRDETTHRGETDG